MEAWWIRFPGRLEAEQQALTAAGIDWQLDEAAWQAGKVVLRLSFQVGGEDYNLIARFPDLYPYFRPEVEAPDLLLSRHQNPLVKNLCLIGRATDNWHTKRLLADLLQQQFPKVLEINGRVPPGPEPVTEEPQGEPYTDYYPYHPGARILIGGWDLPADVRRGFLRVGLRAGLPIHGAVLEVLDERKQRLVAADPAIQEAYGKLEIRARWVRQDHPVLQPERLDFLSEIARQHDKKLRERLPNNKPDEPDLIAVIAPEEVRPNERADGWVFLVRDRLGMYYARAQRYTRARLQERIPELAPLAGKKVVLVGLGSLGGPIALELARAGIGRLAIVDHDFVEATTTVRWPLGLTLAGENKAKGLERVIKADYPYVTVKGYPMRIGDPQPDDLLLIEELLEGADLIIDASAEHGVGLFLADLAAERGIPYLWAVTRPGAWGGIIGRIRPGSTAGCRRCYEHARQDGTVPLPPQLDTLVQPLGCADPTFTGAGFDAATVALFAVRMTVGTLCAGAAGGYPDGDWDIMVISLRDGEGRITEPHAQTLPLIKHPGCDCS